MGLLQHCVELSRPVLNLLPKDFKTGIKKLIRYNINTPGYWDTIWGQESHDTWRTYPNKYPYLIKHLPETGELLDIGCGVGILLRKIREARPNLDLTGADISSIGVRHLEAAGFKGVVGGFPMLPMDNDSFDVVIASEVLEHLSDPDTAVRETARLCRPDGLTILTVPDDCLGPEDEVQHLRKYTHETLMAQLTPYYETVEMASIPDLGHRFLVAVCRQPAKN